MEYNAHQFSSLSAKNAVILLSRLLLLLLSAVCVVACSAPKQKIVLRQIRDVVVDANADPVLKANAVFYNPNDMRAKLKRINVIVYVDGKRAAHVDQKLKMIIPAQNEFTVPLEINLSIKDLGFMDTLLGVLGGKKFEVRYQGALKLTYRGVPINIPVDYKDDVRIKF